MLCGVANTMIQLVLFRAVQEEEPDLWWRFPLLLPELISRRETRENSGAVYNDVGIISCINSAFRRFFCGLFNVEMDFLY